MGPRGRRRSIRNDHHCRETFVSAIPLPDGPSLLLSLLACAVFVFIALIPSAAFGVAPQGIRAKALAAARRHHGQPTGVPLPPKAEAEAPNAYFMPPSPKAIGRLRKSNAVFGDNGTFSGLTPPPPPFEGSEPAPPRPFGNEPQRAHNDLGLRCTGGYCPPPPLRYLGGIVQHEPKVHVIFWGSNWNSVGKEARTKILKMFEGLSGSSFQGVLTQYFDPTGRISSIVQVDSYTDTSVTAPTNVSFGSIAEEVAAMIGKGKPWPARELNAQFAVLTAPGTTYASGFSGFCAYHDVDSQGGIFLALPWAGDPPFSTENGCQSYYGKGDAMKATSLMASHEYAEAATDPLWNTQPAWLDTEGYENADMCATPYDELPNGTFVQGSYDDHQSACSISDEKPPQVLALTDTATNVTNGGAQIRGIVNPESLATTYHFEYGTTTAYGMIVPVEEVSVGSGRSNIEVEEALTGLKPEQVYHYRISATNSSGTTHGEDRTFYTSKWFRRQAARGPEWKQDGLESVSCSSPETCMAVGGYYDLSFWKNGEEVNRILSYQLINGHWVQRMVPEPPGTLYPGYSDDSCSAANACTAVGYGWNAAAEHYAALIGRWNGSKWTEQAPPAFVNSHEALLEGVSCASANECMAVGEIQSSPGIWENLSVRWREGIWETLTMPTASNYAFGRIDDVSCTSASFCVAVGWHNPASGGGPQPDILAWNGSTWSFQTPALPSSWGLGGVTCISSTFCLALSINGTIQRWDGSKWTAQTPASTPDLEWSAFEGASCSSTTNCTAVGYGGSKFNGERQTLAETWNGTSWTEQTTPRENERIANYLTGISCTGKLSCATVGVSNASGQLRSLMETREMPVAPMFSTSFGTEGTGYGQFNFPRGIAIDANNNIWVADGANNRVQKFNAKGQYVSQFGSFGPANGQFKTPVDIAIDANGNLWVTDAENARVKEFNPKGEYLAQFGVYGTGPGGFIEPTGIAIDTSGNFWVTDHLYARAEEFNSKREYVRTIPSGAGAPELNAPAGVAIDPEGHVWIASQSDNRLLEFSSTGEYIGELGRHGVAEGQFAEPTMLDFKPNGDLLVADYGGGRVQEFSSTGEYLTQFGGLWGPDGLAVGTDGSIYASSSQRNRVERWAQAPMAITGEAQSVGLTNATVTGVVNPGGVSTTYQFEYVNDATFKSSGYTNASRIPASPQSIGSGTTEVQVSNDLEGLSVETTYHFRVVATSEVGTTYGKDLTFTTAVSTAARLAAMAVTEPFNGTTASLNNFNSNFSALGWASGATPKGEDTTAGWRSVAVFPTLQGVSYNISPTDAGNGIAGVITLAANPEIKERYDSLWLDMSTPTSTKAGYELRFEDVATNSYNVTLSKWVTGVQTVLASKTSYSFLNGNSFALVDQGSTVSAWINTGSGFTQLLSASDSAFSGGKAGLAGAGNMSRLTNFKAGGL